MPGLLLATVAILLAATVLLAVVQVVRGWTLGITWCDQSVLLSRYTRTVWCTALVVVTASATALLDLPAPDIVYRAF
jgi:hypothetical protein